jgi:hypothetical protein
LHNHLVSSGRKRCSKFARIAARSLKDILVFVEYCDGRVGYGPLAGVHDPPMQGKKTLSEIWKKPHASRSNKPKNIFVILPIKGN